MIVILFCTMVYFFSYSNDQVERVMNNNPKIYNVSNSTKPNSHIVIKLEYCNCQRRIQRKENIIETDFSQTTCGQDAYQRGSNQKILAFSFYGNPKTKEQRRRKYFQGIERNLAEMGAVYGKAWTMRLYIDLELSSPVFKKLCSLACSNNNFDLCLASNLPGNPVRNASNIFPRIWRFFPTLDPQVDILLSRDLDSLIGPREVSAVREWLKSGKLIHSMRDHPQHQVPMLAGTWGARLTSPRARQKWKTSWDLIMKHKMTTAPPNATNGPDQIILQHAVWSWWGKYDSMEHDSYNCRTFRNAVGFPTERKLEKLGNFVGGQQAFWKECPEICKRKGHHDWKYC